MRNERIRNMGVIDCGVLVIQLIIMAIAAVIAAATRTRQDYNEYYGKLEEFHNLNSPWPLILVTMGSGMLLVSECYWALTYQRENALLFLAVLVLQGMATRSAATRVLSGFKPA